MELLAQGIVNPLLPASVREDQAGLAVFIAIIWTSAFLVGGLAVLLYLIYGALMYITSAGDAKAAENAGKIIINAVAGLAILAVSFALITLIGSIFGIDILEPVFPRLR